MALPAKMKQYVEIQQIYSSDSMFLHVSDPQEWVAFTQQHCQEILPGEDQIDRTKNLSSVVNPIIYLPSRHAL